MSTKAFTHTNQLQISIPNDDSVDFFTTDDLALLPIVNLSSPSEDKEDYSKW